MSSLQGLFRTQNWRCLLWISRDALCGQHYAALRLTEPYEDDSNPASYGMLVPVVRAGCNDDTDDKLTDEHSWDWVSTTIANSVDKFKA